MILNLSGQPASGAAQGTAIKDTDSLGFNDDVVRASMTAPVIVDFWAPWCQPCKQLTPLLEKLVQETGGRVRLVKINIDTNQELAMQLRIQSVPTVYAFVGGRPVDAFVGAQPESKLRQFIDQLLRGSRSPVEGLFDEAQAALDAGDARTAAARFIEVLREDPRHVKAIAGAIRARVALRDLTGARKLADGLPQDLATAPEVRAAITAIELAEETRKAAGDLADLERRAAQEPPDPAARYDLALARYGSGDSEAAVELLLDMVRRDREWNDAAARKQLLKIFDALGPSHPLTVASRRRLSSLLFS